MSFVADIVGSVLQRNDAKRAAQIQAGAAQAGITEQGRQFDAIVDLMSPFVTAGQGAIGAQGDLLGLGGDQAQTDAITGLTDSPAFQSIYQQGEDAILQNASATGGLRGGDTQGALARYRPQLLDQFIQRQIGNLGGLASIGQASAGLQAQAGQNTGNNIANLLGNQGSALAGGALASGNFKAGVLNSFGKSAGILAGFF